MLKALAFTQGRNTPSARFRVRQYQPYLDAYGATLDESAARFGSYPPPQTWRRPPWLAATLAERALAALTGNRAQVVLFQREMVSTLYSAERLCRVPAVLDVDDAIWLTQRAGAIDHLAQRCRLILCGNAYLADYFAKFAPVRILPTGVDTTLWVPGTPPPDPVIVWSGSASGLPYLYELTPILAEVLRRHPRARLRVCSNQAPQFTGLKPEQIEFVRWSTASEIAAVQSATLGLMPMPDTPWTRGKCSFKMLTYLAAGIPCVAAPWGMNQQVIDGGGALGAATPAQWGEHIEALLTQPEATRALGQTGRAQVEARYATARLAPELARALTDAATG